MGDNNSMAVFGYEIVQLHCEVHYVDLRVNRMVYICNCFILYMLCYIFIVTLIHNKCIQENLLQRNYLLQPPCGFPKLLHSPWALNSVHQGGAAPLLWVPQAPNREAIKTGSPVAWEPCWNRDSFFPPFLPSFFLPFCQHIFQISQTAVS